MKRTLGVILAGFAVTLSVAVGPSADAAQAKSTTFGDRGWCC